MVQPQVPSVGTGPAITLCNRLTITLAFPRAWRLAAVAPGGKPRMIRAGTNRMAKPKLVH